MREREQRPVRDEGLSVVHTSDLDLASYLLAQGAELVGIDEADLPNRRVFVLRGSTVRALVSVYNSGQARVGVDGFRSARRDLLDRLHRAGRVR